MKEETIYELYKFAEKVQPIYELLKWEWADEGVPNRQQIVDNIKELLGNLEKDGVTHSATGGLYAEKDEEGCIHFGMDISGHYFFKV